MANGDQFEMASGGQFEWIFHYDGILCVSTNNTSLLQHNEQEVYIRSKPQEHESLIQQRLGLKQLLLIPKNKIAEYL